MVATDSPVAAAQRTADRAARRAGYTVRCLTGLAELAAVPSLIRSVWHPPPDNAPMSIDTVTAFSLAGCYVGGVLDGERLIGTCVAVFGEPDHRHLHSHIAAVHPEYRGRHVGTMLKLHQRAWALERGVQQITWTFDPLVRRNAYLNIGKLRAVPVRYAENLYGVFDDPINGHDESDRLIVRWDLLSERVRRAWEAPPAVDGMDGATEMTGPGDALLIVSADQRPVRRRADGELVTVDVPAGIDRLRARRPDLARLWRATVRDVLGGLLRDGATVSAFDLKRGYVIRRGNADSA